MLPLRRKHSLELDTRQGNGRDIQLAAYYAHDTRNELNFGDIRNTVDVDFLDRFPLSRQQLSWGLTVRFSHGNEVQAFSGLTFTPPQRTDELYQGFIQDEISLVKNRLIARSRDQGPEDELHRSARGTERPTVVHARLPPRRSGRHSRTHCALLPTWSAISIFQVSWETRPMGCRSSHVSVQIPTSGRSS